jgi:hypothetical protein
MSDRLKLHGKLLIFSEILIGVWAFILFGNTLLPMFVDNFVISPIILIATFIVLLFAFTVFYILHFTSVQKYEDALKSIDGGGI